MMKNTLILTLILTTIQDIYNYMAINRLKLNTTPIIVYFFFKCVYRLLY